MLKRLEEKGYVYRIKDGKKKKILLTDHCKKKLSKRSQAKIEFVELLEKNNISLEELRIFVMSLKKISDVLGQATEYFFKIEVKIESLEPSFLTSI